MNNLTKALLGSVAVSALTAVPAAARDHHAMRVTALHAGHAVNKTKVHNQGGSHITYTFGIYSSVAFSQYYRHKLPLPGTFYKWNSNGTTCSNTKQKFKVDPKKTQYGRASVGTETYSVGCPSGPTTFYGIDYKITDPNAQGHTDHVRGIYKATIMNSGKKYKGTLNLDVSIPIE